MNTSPITFLALFAVIFMLGGGTRGQLLWHGGQYGRIDDYEGTSGGSVPPKYHHSQLLMADGAATSPPSAATSDLAGQTITAA